MRGDNVRGDTNFNQVDLLSIPYTNCDASFVKGILNLQNNWDRLHPVYQYNRWQRFPVCLAVIKGDVLIRLFQAVIIPALYLSILLICLAQIRCSALILTLTQNPHTQHCDLLISQSKCLYEIYSCLSCLFCKEYRQEKLYLGGRRQIGGTRCQPSIVPRQDYL